MDAGVKKRSSSLPLHPPREALCLSCRYFLTGLAFLKRSSLLYLRVGCDLCARLLPSRGRSAAMHLIYATREI
jgi:hypothetical protein